MKQALWAAAFSVLVALLGAGLIILLSSRPRGQPVTLLPPPTPAPITVHVAGAVSNPGVYSLPVDSRVQDAIQAAGGLLPEANGDGLNMAAVLEDGQQVIAPQAAPQEVTGASRDGELPESTRSAGQPSGELVNINTATQEELESLPGIGPERARNILAYRQEHGPFTSVEALLEVDGIGPGILSEIQALVTTGLNP